MNIFNKTLVAAAITGLVAIPAANADVDSAYYTKNASGTVTFSGSQCKTLRYKKLNSTAFISDGFEGSFDNFFEGSFEGGPNTGSFLVTLQESTFGPILDGQGPLIASNKGRTYNMDTSANDYFELQNTMVSYMLGNLPGQDDDDKDGCKNPDFFNDDLMVNRYELKISNNGKKARLRMDAEGTYTDDNTKVKDNRKLKVKVNANMDLSNPS